MKENSIEEALEKLSNGKKIKIYELLRTFKREGIENFVTTRKKYIDVILSDYKRVLKENEELNKENEDLHREINRRIKLKIENEKIVDTQFIYKQKIEDKIEELNQYYKKEIYPSLYQWCDITITEHYDEMIELLQELLGDK